jgi:hypothetical protein
MRHARRALVTLCAVLVATVTLGVASQPAADRPQPRFVPVDVFVDSGSKPLAAYQLEFQAIPADAHAAATDVILTGVEGGEHEAFREPPYYDAAALQQNRIILAAFSTAEALPVGRVRVARLHLQVTGGAEPRIEARVMTAGTRDAAEITATVSVEPAAR